MDTPPCTLHRDIPIHQITQGSTDHLNLYGSPLQQIKYSLKTARLLRDNLHSKGMIKNNRCNRTIDTPGQNDTPLTLTPWHLKTIVPKRCNFVDGCLPIFYISCYSTSYGSLLTKVRAHLKCVDIMHLTISAPQDCNLAPKSNGCNLFLGQQI